MNPVSGIEGAHVELIDSRGEGSGLLSPDRLRVNGVDVGAVEADPAVSLAHAGEFGTGATAATPRPGAEQDEEVMAWTSPPC